eukprot:GEMP01041506.1.p1 GENE.GEMP01041506.1~~GEMP01041506.1.p1  ORF type:complete len:529 (+),score=100.95 GEMP01041506.1:108-1694(+)
MTSFNDFVHWVQHFQQERKAPVFHPKPTKPPRSKTEDEVRRLRAVLFATEEGNFGATEKGYLAGMKGQTVSPEEEAVKRKCLFKTSKLPCSYEEFLAELLALTPDECCDTLLSVLTYCPRCTKCCFNALNCHECGADIEQAEVSASPNPYMRLVYRSGQARWLSDPFIEQCPSEEQASQETATRIASVNVHQTHGVMDSGADFTESGADALLACQGESIESSPAPEEHATEQTVYHCALCGQSALDVQATPNVFTSFIYGIESLGGETLMLDVRYEDREFILIDDPLNICLFHANCIPTDVYIPDWRTLLTNPAKGLALIDRMVALGFAAIKEAWNNERWRALMSPSERDSFSNGDIQTNMITGFAIPSNQRQLALHVLCPPFTPQQYRRLLTQEEFLYKQWFPTEYVSKILTLCVRRGIQLTAEDVNMPIGALIAFFDDISYDTIHTKALQRYAKVHRQLAHFPIEQFDFIVGDGKIVPTQRNEPPQLPADQEAMREHDRKIFTPSGSTRKIYGYQQRYPLPHWIDT